MFVISDELFARIEPHILLPDTIKKIQRSKWQSKKWKFKPRVLPKILINTADTAKFKKLYGIGEILAERIVNYRRELGGFHSKEQLKEVWGLPEETLLKLDTQLIFNKIEVNKLSVNVATVEELKTHPYIRWKIANTIVKYRSQHGLYQNLEGLKNSVLITDSIYNRIVPYLEL